MTSKMQEGVLRACALRLAHSKGMSSQQIDVLHIMPKDAGQIRGEVCGQLVLRAPHPPKQVLPAAVVATCPQEVIERVIAGCTTEEWSHRPIIVVEAIDEATSKSLTPVPVPPPRQRWNVSLEQLPGFVAQYPGSKSVVDDLECGRNHMLGGRVRYIER